MSDVKRNATSAGMTISWLDCTCRSKAAVRDGVAGLVFVSDVSVSLLGLNFKFQDFTTASHSANIIRRRTRSITHVIRYEPNRIEHHFIFCFSKFYLKSE